MSALLLLGLLLGPAARAEEADDFPELFCAGAAQIQPRNEYCQDNDVFVRSAEACLARLRGEVNREGEVVKGFFSAKNMKGQNEDFSHSGVDHKAASTRLARLIRLARKTALEVDTYFDKVWFPVDADDPEVNQGDFKGYIMSMPCYGETVKSLDSIMQDIEQIGRELTAAKRTADGIAAHLDQREEKITEISGTRRVTAGRGQGGGKAVPAGRSPAKASTITGEVREKVDTKKLNK